MGWESNIAGLLPTHAAQLSGLPQRLLTKGHVLFRTGDPASGFVIVLKGRIEVYLVGPSGREILLYQVEPGQSCIQTTLGLLGDDLYSGEAIAATDVQVVIIPKSMFLGLMDADPGFRKFVLQSFAQRMHDVTHLLEQVAFGRIESRLAETLLDIADGADVHATQAELAARIGSAREVVTRRLDAFARAGWIKTDRGTVRILDANALRQRAALGL